MHTQETGCAQFQIISFSLLHFHISFTNDSWEWFTFNPFLSLHKSPRWNICFQRHGDRTLDMYTVLNGGKDRSGDIKCAAFSSFPLAGDSLFTQGVIARSSGGQVPWVELEFLSNGFLLARLMARTWMNWTLIEGKDLWKMQKTNLLIYQRGEEQCQGKTNNWFIYSAVHLNNIWWETL